MFYTYLWLREDGTPYYVGKGKGLRAFRHGCPVVEVIPGWIDEPDKERIVVQPFESEEDAFFAEKFLIAVYGRKDNVTGCLRNLTDGGEGSNYWQGKQRTEETKKKLRKPRPNAQKSVCLRGHKRVPGNGKCLECQDEDNASRYPGILGLTPEEKVEHKRASLSESHKGKVPWNKGLVITIKQTHCKRGHLRSPENVDKIGACKPCRRERENALRK